MAIRRRRQSHVIKKMNSSACLQVTVVEIRFINQKIVKFISSSLFFSVSLRLSGKISHGSSLLLGLIHIDLSEK